MKNDIQTSPKAKQFTEELNDLLKKYQYKLSPEISYTKAGIVPVVNLVEVVPPKTVQPVVEEVPSGTSGAPAKGKDEK